METRANFILIGAFALGHSTADQGVAETEAPVAHESVIEPGYDSPAPQGCRFRSTYFSKAAPSYQEGPEPPVCDDGDARR